LTCREGLKIKATGFKGKGDETVVNQAAGKRWYLLKHRRKGGLKKGERPKA